jgi:hypothetical protein
MRTTPSRRTTLQFLQIFLTDALTFIVFMSALSRSLVFYLYYPAFWSCSYPVVRPPQRIR